MDYTEIMISLITAVFVPGLIWLVKRVDDYVTEKMENEKMDQYFHIACDSVETAVKEISQVYVDKLQGEEWNETTKKEAFELAKNRSLEIMGFTARKFVAQGIGDFDSWLQSKIEATVKEGM